MKTVRFTRVVERSGRPHVHTLWVAPDEDAEFRRARDAHRVMTVRKSDSGKSDAGIVGFKPARDGSDQFLVFPKSLKPFAGSRVVGLKFDLVDQPRTIAAPAVIPHPARARSRTASRHPSSSHGAPRSLAPRDEPPARKERESPEAPVHNKRSPVRERPPPRKVGNAATRRVARQVRSDQPEARTSGLAAAHRALLREVRLAMKELEAGRAVAAYQRLEHAIAEAP